MVIGAVALLHASRTVKLMFESAPSWTGALIALMSATMAHHDEGEYTLGVVFAIIEHGRVGALSLVCVQDCNFCVAQVQHLTQLLALCIVVASTQRQPAQGLS